MMSKMIKEVQTKYLFLNDIFTNTWSVWRKAFLKNNIKSSERKWKNSKAMPGCAYIPTNVEQFANVVTHAVCIIPAILAAYELFKRSHTTSQLLVSSVYGGSLTMLFSMSTFFHCSCYSIKYNAIKNVLHRIDRAMIYIFIAGSYFPWLHIGDKKHLAVLHFLEWGIWALAVLGITYQQIFHERYKCLETCLYLTMGLGPAFVILVTGHEFHGMLQLKLGGIVYILGICFFKSDGLIPLAHAIWHLFVVIAAGCHYYAILNNLFPKKIDDNYYTND